MTKLRDYDWKFENDPESPFCGWKMGTQRLKITHGAPSRTFRTDRVARHRFH